VKFGRRIALDPTAAAAGYCWRAAGVRRFAWNWGKARWDEDWAKAKAEPDPEKRKALWPSTEKLKKEWAAVRIKEFPWSLDVTKCAGTQAIMDLGAAYARAQKEPREAKAQGRKPRKMFGFPKFKAKNKTVPAFALWNDQFSLCNHLSVTGNDYTSITIPHLGSVRLRELVPSFGGILGARISYRRGRWFIAFQYDMDWNDGEQSDKAAQIVQGKARKAAIEAGMSKDEAKATITVASSRPERLLPIHPRAGTVGGGDLGLLDAMVGRVEQVGATDVAEIFRKPNPRRLSRTEKEQRLRRRRERRLSRSIHRARERAAAEAKAKKGDASPVTAADLRGVKLRLSNRQHRLSRQLGKQPWADADRRDDFLHKLALQAARSAEIFVLEDLHVAGMMQNRALAKHISDAGFGKLADYVSYKAERLGGTALFAPRFFPSSKRCSACGVVKEEMDLSEREWTCAACGACHDRDRNAAVNLCWLGQLAAAEGPIPDQAKPWAEWIDEARDQIAAWRRAKAMPRQFLPIAVDDTDEFVGAASSESTRGETMDRGRRKASRKMADEPRTTPGRTSPAQGGQAHVCSTSG
jgi:putative transposase